MRKFYIASVLAIVVIFCLQGYYVHLQYDRFVEEKLTEIEGNMHVSLDQNRGKWKRGNKSQTFSYHVATEDESKDLDQSKVKFRMDTLDIDSLRKKGLIKTAADALMLLSQDLSEKKGHPFDVYAYNNTLKSNLDDSFNYSVLLLDSNKKVIKATHADYSGWYATKDMCISLAKPRFVRVMVDIKPSDFIMKSVWSLSLSLLFSIIIIGVVAYQLTAIRRREELLNARELSLNGTIHDLKSPLNALITLLGVLRMDEENEAKLEAMKVVEDRARQLVNTIETILITAGGTGRRIALDKKPADIGALAMKAKADVDLLADGKEHEITVDDVTGGGTATVDAAYIENVLRNLMENAVKYSDPSVKVRVTIEREDGVTRVSVSDTGWGIPRKYMRHLFKQFYRVPGRESVKGFGVGLALVKYIIELHGGRITVDSTEGKGSVFTFTLPDR